MKRNNETLELMLQAERREYPMIDSLDAEDFPISEILDPFDGISRVVDFVKTSIEFDELCRGEIDQVGQEHYLRGPNFDPMMDPDYWKEHQHYGENK